MSVGRAFFDSDVQSWLYPAVSCATAALMDLPLVRIDTNHIQEALRGEDRYQISFWDALIVAAAEAGGAHVLYTEDLNNGQQYGSVRVENPFIAVG